jgi:hypothetical protein
MKSTTELQQKYNRKVLMETAVTEKYNQKYLEKYDKSESEEYS